MRSDDYSKRSATASAEKGSGRETPISTRRPVTPVPPVAAPPVIERATLAPVPPSAFVNDTQHQGKKGRRPSVLPALRTTDLTVGQLKPLPAIDIPDRRKCMF